jgi:hypothetical protein
MRKAWVAAATVVLLAGCVTQPSGIDHAHLIGQSVTAVGAPREADGNVTIYRPGDLQLMALYPPNLNIFLDEHDVIVRMTCG